MRNHEFPLLGGIAAGIRWLEELVSLVSGPLLTVGLGIALVDLLTGGRLLSGLPELLFVWAIAQAVGIDAQLVAAWDRCRAAIREKRWLSVFGLVVLGCALGYVGFLSAEAFGFQQAFGLSESDALARLGIDGVTWQLQRAGLAVFLVALSGFTRYHAPPKARKSLEEERAELMREAELEPLRQRVRGMKALGAVSLAKSVLAGRTDIAVVSAGADTSRSDGEDMSRHVQEEAPKFPTAQQTKRERKTAEPVIRMVAPSAPKSARERVYAVLNRDSSVSKAVGAQRARVSPTTFSKYRQEWLQEQRQAEPAAL